MRRNFLGLVLFSVMIASCSTNPSIPVVGQVKTLNPIPHDSAQATRPAILSKVIVRIPVNTVIGETRQGNFCIFPKPRVWGGDGDIRWGEKIFYDTFNSILKDNGYTVVEGPDSIFESYKPAGSELIFGAIIVDVKENYCSGLDMGAGAGIYKGSTKLKIKWEVYSLADRRVIFQAITEGSYNADFFAPLGQHNYSAKAFGNSLRNLLAMQGLVDILTGKVLSQEPSDVAI